MAFSGSHDKVIYIKVSIKLHVGEDMDSGQQVCDVLDHNKGTWWICDDEIITNYSGYPENVYNDLSHENEKRGK